MRVAQKPIADQVIVITGASSGIGLATARLAVRRGASVFLASRGEAVLAKIARDLEAAGGRVGYAVADVGSEADVRRIAEGAIERFGGFDTWVNNAGTSVYANLTDLPLPEHRRIFETNYWGMVHGSLAAVAHFRTRPGGGTLVNVGSAVGDVAVPYLSAYAASKHAVKGFTTALRTELIHDGVPVQVSLIKPSGIATPFPQHARSRIGSEPRVVPPLYAPELVADAILHAATHPVRELSVGIAGAAMKLGTALAPNLMDRLLAFGVPPVSRESGPLTPRDGLDQAAGSGETHWRGGRGIPYSPYTQLRKYPSSTLALGLVGLGILALRRLAMRRDIH